MKRDLVKKIKDAVIDHGGMLMPDATTSMGEVYSVVYNGDCDSVEVNVIISQSLSSTEISAIDAEYLTEKDLENILNNLI